VVQAVQSDVPLLEPSGEASHGLNRRLDLGGADWEFAPFLGDEWIWKKAHEETTGDVRWMPATVPGSVHDDLWRCGEIADPYSGRNSLLSEWVPARTWVYRKTFRLPSMRLGTRASLLFRGVDHDARFYLNGHHLGDHSGMFTPARFELDRVLRADEPNTLAVVLLPAPAGEPQVGVTARVRTLKSRMNYGWDFCPRMVHVGIWDDVRLDLTGAIGISDVYVRPRLNSGLNGADLRIAAQLEAPAPVGARVETTILAGGRVVGGARSEHRLAAGTSSITQSVLIDRPELWWPNGCGEPALHSANVRVIDEDGLISHERMVTFGIRRVELLSNDTPDLTARPYTFAVNGRRLYVNGWNWVPMDVLYGVERPAKLARLIELARRANVNLLRVWGGGLIEKESFYALCDRAGIMVWQEFAQSSSGIASTPAEDADYVEAVARQADGIVRAKRNHASLVVWCGGNELADATGRPLDESSPVLRELRAVVRRLDPDRHWLPTSPSGPVSDNTLSAIDSNPDALHDVHGPWEHQGLTEHCRLYNRSTSLFHSEFGAEGITNRAPLDAAVPLVHQWPPTRQNREWTHRGAWWINDRVVTAAFGRIGDMDDFIRASQYLQAEALRYAIEANRRRQWRNSGSIPWQLNEPFPNGYCTSAVDYFARPKAAYYAVAQAYAPLSVSAGFPTWAWGDRAELEATLWTANATEDGYANARLDWALIDISGAVHAGGSCSAAIAANAATRIGEIRVPLSFAEAAFFLDLRLTANGAPLADARYAFSGARDLAPFLDLPATTLELSCRARGERWDVGVTNAGEHAAFDVRLEDARDVRSAGYAYFEHNHFSLLPGETQAVDIEWHDVPAPQRSAKVSAWNARAVPIA
jgi:beta-mannosidase